MPTLVALHTTCPPHVTMRSPFKLLSLQLVSLLFSLKADQLTAECAILGRSIQVRYPAACSHLDSPLSRCFTRVASLLVGRAPRHPAVRLRVWPRRSPPRSPENTGALAARTLREGPRGPLRSLRR